MSKIEWTDKTWNPITGCTPVSPGCEHCYAARMANRLAGRFGYPEDEPFRPGTVHEDKLLDPLDWKKPRRVFVCSMGDLFHEDVAWEWISKVWQVMLTADQHVFQILTKRPARAREFFADRHHPWPGGKGPDWAPPNIWIGVTAENQATANKRLPQLLQIPAAVRFVSCEPLLGPVDLNGTSIGQVLGPCDHCGHRDSNPECEACMGIPSLDWVIAGGESGPGARPSHPDWFRSLRDQCQAANAPFFLKQWGAWAPSHLMENYEHRDARMPGLGIRDGDVIMDTDGAMRPCCFGMSVTAPLSDSEVGVRRVGKKAAGRHLDGRTWDQFPEVE